MKKIIFLTLLTLCFHLNQGQNIASNWFKTPRGFVYIPNALGSKENGFYLLKECVSVKQFELFLNDLKAKNKMNEWTIATQCLASVQDGNKDMPVKLNTPQAISIYAKWLGEKLTTNKSQVQTRIPTKAEWNQAFPNFEEQINPYGLSTPSPTEWVQTENGIAPVDNTITNNYGNATKEGTFRLLLTFINKN